MIRVACQCGKSFTLADHLAGRSFRCTSCGGTIKLPSASEAQAAAPAAAPAAPPPQPQGAAKAWGKSAPAPGAEPALDLAPADGFKAAPAPAPAPPGEKPLKLPWSENLQLADEPPPSQAKILAAALDNEPISDEAPAEKKKAKPAKKAGRKSDDSDEAPKKKKKKDPEPEDEPEPATTDCPVCGATVPKTARECPTCKVNLRGKGGMSDSAKAGLRKAGVGVGIVVVAGAVIGAIVMMRDDSGGTAPRGKPRPSASAASTPTPEPEKPKPTETPPAKQPEKTPSPEPSRPPEKQPEATPEPTPDKTPEKPPEPQVIRIPDGPLKESLEALRDAADIAGLEKAVSDLATKPGLSDAVRDCNKVADGQLKGRLWRALLAGADDAKRSDILDRAFSSADVPVLVAAVECAADHEGLPQIKGRIGEMRAKDQWGALAEGLAVVLTTDDVPSVVSVDAAASVAEKADADLRTRLSVLLLRGGEGSQLAVSADAFLVRSPAMRKAAKRSLEVFSGRKGQKDPATDAASARDEWSAWTTTYAPVRAKLLKACEDGLAKDLKPEALGAIVDARLDLLAKKKDLIPFLTTFSRETAARSTQGGAGLAELIARICGPGDREVLVQITDGLTEDSRFGAPAIVGAALRVCDVSLAQAAARAVDRGAISFRDAAVSFPDLLEPTSAPKTAFDSSQPDAMIVCGAFRDAKALEKVIFDAPKSIPVEEPLARCGSKELEKKLVGVASGKERWMHGTAEEAAATLGEIATAGYVNDVAHLYCSKYEDKVFSGLSSSVDKAATPQTAMSLFKLVENSVKDKGAQFAQERYLLAAAHAVLGTENRGDLFRAMSVHTKQPPAPKKGETPAPVPYDPLRQVCEKAEREGGWPEIHHEAVKALDLWVKDTVVNHAPRPPEKKDLEFFLHTAHASSAAEDQKLLASMSTSLGTITSKQDRELLGVWIYRALARFKVVAELEHLKQETAGIPGILRGEAAAALGRIGDAGSGDILMTAAMSTVQRGKCTKDDAGLFAGLSMIRPPDGASVAHKALAVQGQPVEVLETVFFALARGGAEDDARTLLQWSKTPDPEVRAAMARGLAFAYQTPQGAPGCNTVLDRLRIDPSPLVRVEAAIAALWAKGDSSAMLDAAIAMDADREILKRVHQGTLPVAVGADASAGADLFLELAHGFEHASKGSVRLDARAGMGLGRMREITRTARAGIRKGA